MKKLIMLLSLIALGAAAFAAGNVSVTAVEAHQRYPWNGLVDIVVTLEGSVDDMDKAVCSFVATNKGTGLSVPVESVTWAGGDAGSGTTWTWRFVWNAFNDVGAVTIDDIALTVDAKVLGGGVQLWKNGPYWAECNVGVTKAEQYGYYFWWGGTVGCRRNYDNTKWVSVKDGTSCYLNGYLEGMDNSQLQSEGYIDSTGNLVAAHDAASAYLGAPWRMPTYAEFAALSSNCDMTWTKRNGVQGWLVVGKGAYATKSIFLPAAGFGCNNELCGAGSYAYYWSSTPIGDRRSAWQLDSWTGGLSSTFRGSGMSVRPVRGFAQGVSGSVGGGVTTHLKLDCRTGVRAPSQDGVVLRYDAGWYENGDEVRITEDGAVVTTGTAGVYTWHPTPSCLPRHVLKLEVLSSGQVIGTETAEFESEGHIEYVSKEAVAPTYYSTGSTEEISCSRCHAVLQESAVVPKLIAEIVRVDVEPISPWGKVAVRYEVRGDLPRDRKSYRAFVVVKDRDLGTEFCFQPQIGDVSLTEGWHNVIADIAAVKPGFRSTNCVVTVFYRKPMYCVLDLTSADHPVKELGDVPVAGWGDEYKTSKLVLRRIEAGSFIMGEDQGDENHRVLFSKPFCIGIFEVTQKQWMNVSGSNPSFFYSWETRPVETVSYNMIRGANAGAGWPNSSAVDVDSFLGRLRTRTGLGCDLPTEAQWEYACRAGTGTKFNNGTASINGLGRYSGNGGSPYHWESDPSAGTAKVGSYTPNAWGLYDMHGNVPEWCLDWNGTQAYGSDPEGPASGSGRVMRGGSFESGDHYCSSYYRVGEDPSIEYQSFGFRLAMPIPYAEEIEIGAESTIITMPSEDDILCSKMSPAFSVCGLKENEETGSPMEIYYAPYSPNGVVEVGIDGETIAALDEDGSFVWQPNAIGPHLFVHRTDGIEWPLVVNITNMSYCTLSVPNPPGPTNSNVSVAERKEFANAKKSANTVAVSSTGAAEIWNACVSDAWIQLTRSVGTSGVHKVVYSVEANTNAAARTGYVYVSGHVHTVVQPGTGAEVSPETLTADCHGLTREIAIDTAVEGVPWNVRPDVSWISVRPTSGFGDGSVTLCVAPYYVVGTREGFVTIAGRRVCVSQRGRELQLVPESTNVTAAAQSLRISVRALDDVSWNWESSADWVSIQATGPITGSAMLELNLSENEDYFGRVANLTINGERLAIHQDGTTNRTLSVDEKSAVVPARATVDNCIGVSATPGMPWFAVSDCSWISFSKGAAFGPGTVEYSVQANPEMTRRTGHITVTPDGESGLAPCVVEVTQQAAEATLSSYSTNVYANAQVVLIDVNVDPGVCWTLSNAGGNGWASVAGDAVRTGPQTVTLHILENTTINARACHLSIADYTYEIQQAGGTVNLSSTRGEIGAEGGDLSIRVACSSNLNWSVQSGADWVLIEGSSSRKGAEDLVVRVETNGTIYDRCCEVVVGGQKIQICQVAAKTAVEQDVFTFTGDVVIDSFHVEAPSYLTWSVVTTNSWIEPTSTESVTGPGEVEYIVDELTDASSRIGIIWVGKTPVYICQSGFETALGENEKTVSRLSGAGQIVVDVESEDDEWCAMSTVPWISLVKTSGGASEGVQYVYEANTTGVARVGRILVNDQVFTLTQTHVDPSVPCWAISYENLKGAANPNPDIYAEGEGVTFAALPNVTGYTFAGWMPSAIGENESGAKTVRANWTANAYSVAFNANGGTGTMADLAMTYDAPNVLPQNSFARTGYAFAGWWTTNAMGMATFADKAVVSNLTAAANGVVTLYANWTTVPYSINYLGTKDAANSNPATYTVEDALTFAALPNVPGYTFTGWSPASVAVGTTGPLTVTAQWKREMALGDLIAGGIAQRTFGGNANWYEQSSVKHSGSTAWRSGGIGDSQSTWMEISFEGVTEFSFWWKVSSENNYDWLSWSMDGVEQAKISNVTDWARISRAVSSSAHTIRFSYTKDVNQSRNEDCGWVDDICFVCPETVNVTFDLAGKGVRTGGGDLQQTVEFGGSAVLPTVTPNVGWCFDGWPTLGSIYKNTTFTAAYTAIAYAIDYRNTEGAANTNQTTYTIEDNVVFSSLPNIANFTFAGWTPPCIALGSTGDKVVTANWNWTPQNATVEASITGGKKLNIKADWVTTELAQRFGAGKDRAFRERFGADLSAALTKKTGKKDGAGNELSVWQDYVAGTDPTDSNSVFRATMKMVNGFPVIEWEPNLNSNGEERVYTVYGKADLTDDWHSPTNALDRFFKVDVAMPASGEISFDLGGGEGTIEPFNVRIGQAIGELPIPVREGYDFLGWFTEAEGGSQVTPETIVSADLTIYAHWRNPLVHRWSFNGNLTDSIGGQTATIVGNVTTDGSKYKTPGGSSGSAYIDLGNWILPTNGLPVTVELWASSNGSTGWQRIFEFGSMPVGYNFASRDTSCYARDSISMCWNGSCTGGSSGTMGSYVSGTEYHLAAVLEKSGDGAWTATYYKQNATTGATEKKYTATLDASHWPGMKQTEMLLGQALTCWDSVANASYNEVRIWNKAMTEEELTASAIAGPDAEL